MREIGPQICVLIGAACGFVCGCASGFFRIRKQMAMIAFALCNFALAVLVISDDATITAQSNLRSLVIGTAFFHIIAGLISGWVVSSLYTFIGDIQDDTYRGRLFGFNKETEDEITSLNIAHAKPRKRIDTLPVKPVAESDAQPAPSPLPVLESAAPGPETEQIPELLFEPGRDWDFINGTEKETHTAKFEYVAMNFEINEDEIGEMLAGLLPFETASATEKIASRNDFQLYKQKHLAAQSPRITYRNATLMPQKMPAVPQDKEQQPINIEITA